jgi:prepilin-type N-terminal cleavage/methylation domain-containing protein
MRVANQYPQRNGRGFTAFEVLLASAILAILTAAVSGALMAGRAQSKMARDTLNASMLCHALLDEVMRLPTTDPHGYTTLGPDAGETRSGTTAFNSVKDYCYYTDGVGTSTPTITDIAGNAYQTVYQTFVRVVSEQSISYTPANWSATVTGLLVTVTVSRDGVVLSKLQRFACN